MHIEFLVEDSSLEATVEILLNRLMSEDTSDDLHSWRVHPFGDKPKLLTRLKAVVSGIISSRFADAIVVVIDADRDNCEELKNSLHELISSAIDPKAQQDGPTRVWIRIAVTELESWFIGDSAATRTAYPRITEGDLRLSQWRKPDSVPDAWEWLERLLIRRGHYVTRMPKTIVARNISQNLNLAPEHNASPSFRLFLRTIREAYGLSS